MKEGAMEEERVRGLEAVMNRSFYALGPEIEDREASIEGEEEEEGEGEEEWRRRLEEGKRELEKQREQWRRVNEGELSDDSGVKEGEESEEEREEEEEGWRVRDLGDSDRGRVWRAGSEGGVGEKGRRGGSEGCGGVEERWRGGGGGGGEEDYPSVPPELVASVQGCRVIREEPRPWGGSRVQGGGGAGGSRVQGGGVRSSVQEGVQEGRGEGALRTTGLAGVHGKGGEGGESRGSRGRGGEVSRGGEVVRVARLEEEEQDVTDYRRQVNLNSDIHLRTNTPKYTLAMTSNLPKVPLDLARLAPN